MRLAFKIVIVVLAFALLLGGLALYLRNAAASLSQLKPSTPTPSGPISLTASATQTQVFNYNEALTPLIYSLLSYSASNANNATVTMNLYLKNPVAHIYLLNVSAYCVSCFSEDSLRSALQSDLLNYDLVRNSSSFSYINGSSLQSLPDNSIIIVPSGLLPFYLLNGTQPMLLTLMQRGDMILYSGLNLNRTIGPNGIIFVNTQGTLNLLAASNLGTIQLNASTAALAEGSNLSFRNPTFIFAGGRRFGNVTYANSGNGTLIAFSNYPTSSWTSSESMAGDLARAINASFWLPKIGGASSALNLTSKNTGNLGAFAALTGLPHINGTNATTLLNGSYAVLTIAARNAQYSAIRKFVSQNFYVPRGSVSVPANVGITQNIPVQMQVVNVSANLLVHLDLYDRNMSYVGSIPIGFISGPQGIVKYHAFTVPSGYYVLELKDFNNNYYGTAFFNVANLTINPTTLGFKNGTFVFSIYSNDFPVNNATYTVDINGLYQSSGQINDGVLSYTLPQGTLISYGTENFNFDILNTKYVYATAYQQNIINIPPIYIEFGIAALVIILLNLILKPPNRDEYYIDVPEFPPSKREKVKIQGSAVLGVFDKVNYYHRWKYMPLTADELKQGIGSNIRANGIPISITMQNAESVISSLTHGDQLVGASGYYAPKAWVEASKHSIEYLVIFRKLRDYCVSHAILFTDLDSNDTADLLITKDGKQMSVFIYSASSPMKKLTISRDSKTAIVFIDDDSRREFLSKLYDSFGKEAEVLKLGIEYNYIKLADSEHLDQLVL